MWLMTKHGFFSIVEKAPGEFHIRSRESGDLKNLIERVPLTDRQVLVAFVAFGSHHGSLLVSSDLRCGIRYIQRYGPILGRENRALF